MTVMPAPMTFAKYFIITMMEAITVTTMMMMMTAIMMTMMMMAISEVFALNAIINPRIAVKAIHALLTSATTETACMIQSTAMMAIPALSIFALEDIASTRAPAVLLIAIVAMEMYVPKILAPTMPAYTLQEIAMMVMPARMMFATAIRITATLQQGASTSRQIAGMATCALWIIATAQERASVIRLQGAAPPMPTVMMVMPAPWINAGIILANTHQHQSAFQLRGWQISVRAMA
jgi:hypothetical protein